LVVGAEWGACWSLLGTATAEPNQPTLNQHQSPDETNNKHNKETMTNNPKTTSKKTKHKPSTPSTEEETARSWL
jgi:hypothetical protein